MAELFYLVAAQYRGSGQLATTNTSMPFWNYFAPSGNLASDQTYTSNDPAFVAAVSSVEGWADAFMRRIRYHTPADMSLSEEYNRNDGISTGALDLTWSYASVLTAAFARAALRQESEYATAVANLA